MNDSMGRVTLRDATLREGLDTPNVAFSLEQRVRIARHLARARISEVEVVAPSRVSQDLVFVRRLRAEGIDLRASGLIYAYSPDCAREVEEASASLDHFDLLMPVSPERAPEVRETKVHMLEEALSHASRLHSDVGAGFPHSLQCDPAFLLEIAEAAVRHGARRIVVYDTNGSGDPFAIAALIRRLCEQKFSASVFFHAHNDLGLATANSLAAVLAGAVGLDVTVNGLGDRAGNASLEQVALALHLKGFDTGIDLQELRSLSRVVEEESGVVVSKLAPVVGEYVLWHRSPSHLRKPGLFEAFDPQLILSDRKVDDS
jgi:homocitrate synthase NifV